MVQQGQRGEDRALLFIEEQLRARGSGIHVRPGSKVSARANGLLGDILLARSEVDAPELGIEVKASGVDYPNSVCISNWELMHSRASYLLSTCDDESMGMWVVPMDVARKSVRKSFDDYCVIEPGLSARIPMARFIDDLQRSFGEYPTRSAG